MPPVLNPTSFRLPFNLAGKIHPEADQAIRYAFNGMKDLNDALISLKEQHDATANTVAEQGKTPTATGAITLDSNGKIQKVELPLGGVNVQTVSPYTVQGSDYGGIVVINSASAFALTLDSSPTAGFWCFIQNIGTGLLTVTPSTGNINTSAFVTAATGTGMAVFLDGTDWWAEMVVTGNLTEVTSAVLTITGGTNSIIGSGVTIKVTKADATHDGYLAQADWSTFNNKAAQAKFLFSSATAQFDAVATTVLANIPGLTAAVLSAGAYRFRAVLHVNTDVVGGHQYSINGTATATSVIFQVNSISNSANAIVISSRQTALGASAGQAGATSYFTTIDGFITVNAGGTLTVQFAQNVAVGTSSILLGSSFEVYQVP